MSKFLLSKAYWALEGASRRAPYFASLLFRLKPRLTPEVPIGAVDLKGTLYLNPEALERLSPGELEGLILHEVMHLALSHFSRREDREPRRWNVASDLEINPLVQGMGALLPEGGLFPGLFGLPEGRGAEWYYEHLPGEETPQGGEGSRAADGLPKPWEEGEGEGEGLAPEIEAALSEAKEALREALSRGERPGKGAGEVARKLLGIDPGTAWERALLRRLERFASQKDEPRPSYARPSRREEAFRGEREAPVFQGTVRPRRIPRITVVLDVSGSMTEERLGKGWEAVKRVVEALGEATLLPYDDAPKPRIPLRRGTPYPSELVGGGGTDMAGGIEEAAKDRPDAILVITDGETPWPDSPPRVPVLVLLVEEEGLEGLPPWLKGNALVVGG